MLSVCFINVSFGTGGGLSTKGNHSQSQMNTCNLVCQRHEKSRQCYNSPFQREDGIIWNAKIRSAIRTIIEAALTVLVLCLHCWPARCARTICSLYTNGYMPKKTNQPGVFFLFKIVVWLLQLGWVNHHRPAQDNVGGVRSIFISLPFLPLSLFSLVHLLISSLTLIRLLLDFWPW